jgi:hypothetical protein
MTKLQRREVADAAMILADLCEREVVHRWSMTYDRPTPRSRHRAPLFRVVLTRQPYRVRGFFVHEVHEWAQHEYERLGTETWDAYWSASWDNRKRPVFFLYDDENDEYWGYDEEKDEYEVYVRDNENEEYRAR